MQPNIFLHVHYILFHHFVFKGFSKYQVVDAIWHAPNSLRDSNVNPKLKTMKELRIEAIS
jgi:hypothetical protein